MQFFQRSVEATSRRVAQRLNEEEDYDPDEEADARLDENLQGVRTSRGRAPGAGDCAVRHAWRATLWSAASKRCPIIFC